MSTVSLKAYVENISEALDTYTQVRLYSDTSPGGDFSTLADTETLVAGQEEYTLTDTAATAATVWRFRLYNPTGPVQSDLSPLIRPAALTMLRLRMEAARQASAGFDGTCSAAGTTTTLVDAALIDSGVDEAYIEGAWVYRPDAAASGDRVRRVKRAGFDTTAGSLGFARAYANAPAEAEAYQVFNLLPPIDTRGEPYSWDRAIRDGLSNVWLVDQVNLGEGTSTLTTDFSLAAHASYLSKRMVRRVLRRRTDSNGNVTDCDASTQGGWWSIEENGIGNLTLRIMPAPATQESVIVEFNRTDSDLWGDDDVTLVPEPQAVAAVVLAAYRWLNETDQPGRYEREYRGALQAYARASRERVPSDVVIV